MQNKTVGGYLQDADSLRKAVVEEMREAPQKDPNDDRRSVYDAKTWGQMCDQFESDGVWADHHMLHFAPQVLGMRMSCIVGWLNNSHYTRTVPMDENVKIRPQLELKTVLFHYDAPLAMAADTSATQFNNDVIFRNVHAKNWVAQDTVGHGDCLPYTLAACCNVVDETVM